MHHASVRIESDLSVSGSTHGRAVPLTPVYQSKKGCSAQRGVECHRMVATLGVDEFDKDTQRNSFSSFYSVLQTRYGSLAWSIKYLDQYVHVFGRAVQAIARLFAVFAGPNPTGAPSAE